MARSSTERRLEIPKATLIQHAQQNYDKAKAAYDKEVATYSDRVIDSINDAITKLDAMLRKVDRARGIAAIAKASNADSDKWNRKEIYAPLDPPSKSHVCTWKQRLDWLKAAKTETISMTEYEFSSYIQEEC